MLAAESVHLHALPLHSLLSMARTGHMLLHSYNWPLGSSLHLKNQGTKLMFRLWLQFEQVTKADPPNQLLLGTFSLQIGARQRCQQCLALLQPCSGHLYLLGAPAP